MCYNIRTMKQGVGEVIRKRREELGLTREKLAVEAGCSMGSIIRWETGKGEPREIYIKALERVLKIKLQD